jgi:phospholipase C
VRHFIALAAILVLFGCSSQSAGFAPGSEAGSLAHRSTSKVPIDHVVVIVQENRSFTNLFEGFPNARTVTQGLNSKGQTVTLEPVDITAPYDLSHKHQAWVADYDNGKMDGFNLETENCLKKKSRCPARSVAAYSYVPESEIKPYWDLAQQYTLADEMFETSEGPSFPAHQYLISGTSAISNSSDLKASENAADESDVGHQGGCDSLPSTTVETIDPYGNEGNPVFPCFERTSIVDLLEANSLTWRFYQAFPGAGQWHAVDAIKQIWERPAYKRNVIYPSSRVLKDVAAGRLAKVVYVTPTAQSSDHPGVTDGSGPSWVASVVNAIGESKYWDSTAIIVVWDDWGGWYDNAGPTIYNSFEDGFRVPMLVISPYAKSGYVSHVTYEFGSILKFVEETFDLPSMGTTDERANDLSDCFNYSASPRAFRPIRARFSARYFLDRPIDYRSVDTDF